MLPITVTYLYKALHLVTEGQQLGETTMYTTTNENGILNNYAKTPEMYFAQYPSPEQQRLYVIQAWLAAGLVASLVLTAFVVS